MEFTEIRTQIDSIDDQIKQLFCERMALAQEIARQKANRGLPVLDPSREREILNRVTEGLDDQMAGYIKIVFTALFDVSRSFQNSTIQKGAAVQTQIEYACTHTPKLFPKSAPVACQGTEGSNSYLACEKLFARPDILYFNTFDSVFNAVEKGLCRYGILPIENSLYGSVTAVYDLMQQHRFSIAKSVRLKINHALLAKSGTAKEDIKEIYSHEQALGQCSEFLKTLSGVRLIPYENTATAAKMVAASERKEIACIADRSCAELYGLNVIDSKIQNSDNNYTRFICISKELEIYPGANRISLVLTLPHKPGSLYGLISRFSSLGVNLTKLESRPIPGMDFEFRFYFDFEASVEAPEIMNLLCQLDNGSEEFTFLGNYAEG